MFFQSVNSSYTEGYLFVNGPRNFLYSLVFLSRFMVSFRIDYRVYPILSHDVCLNPMGAKLLTRLWRSGYLAPDFSRPSYSVFPATIWFRIAAIFTPSSIDLLATLECIGKLNFVLMLFQQSFCAVLLLLWTVSSIWQREFLLHW